MKALLSFLIFCSLQSLMLCTVNRCYNPSLTPQWQFWQFEETTQTWTRDTTKDDTVCSHCFNNNNNGDCTIKWLITSEKQKNYQERCFCNIAATDPFQNLIDQITALENSISQIDIPDLVYKSDLTPFITKTDAEAEFANKSDLDPFITAADLTPYAKQADLDKTNNNLHDLVNLLSQNPTEECDEAAATTIKLQADIDLLSPPVSPPGKAPAP